MLHLVQNWSSTASKKSHWRHQPILNHLPIGAAIAIDLCNCSYVFPYEMEVSQNRGTPKSSILWDFPLLSIHFGYSIYIRRLRLPQLPAVASCGSWPTWTPSTCRGLGDPSPAQRWDWRGGLEG